jgi:glycerol-3-phosphate dehydrogenase
VALAAERGWHLPICEQVVRLLNGDTDPRQAVQDLMARGPRSGGESAGSRLQPAA